MNLTWFGFCNLLRNPLNLTWLCTKASWSLLRNLLRTLLNLTWLCTKAFETFSGTFSRTFSGTLLNLTWLCTKASGNLLRNPVEPDLALHQSLPDLRNLFRNLLRNPVEPDLALHQSLPDLLQEPSPEPCWTWPGSAPKPPRPPEPFPEPAPEPCWTWLGFAPKPPRPSPEPSKPSREPRWTSPGACTSAHRSYSGLKTPLAYAVGEKTRDPTDRPSSHRGGPMDARSPDGKGMLVCMCMCMYRY